MGILRKSRSGGFQVVVGGFVHVHQRVLELQSKTRVHSPGVSW